MGEKFLIIKSLLICIDIHVALAVPLHAFSLLLIFVLILPTFLVNTVNFLGTTKPFSSSFKEKRNECPLD